MRKFKIRLWQEYNWWVAHCPETGVTTQAGSESEALDNIDEALKLYFEPPSASQNSSASHDPQRLPGEAGGYVEKEVALAD